VAARTVPEPHTLDSRTTAPLTLHDGARGWAHDVEKRPDACSRQAGGRGAYVLSALRGRRAQPLYLPSVGQEVCGMRGTTSLPPVGVSRRRWTSSPLRHHGGDADYSAVLIHYITTPTNSTTST
jgi:hypothetical protein